MSDSGFVSRGATEAEGASGDMQVSPALWVLHSSKWTHFTLGPWWNPEVESQWSPVWKA